MPYKDKHKQKQYQQKWHQMNKNRLAKQQRTTRQYFYRLLSRYKQMKGCAICGYKEFSFALDLHHTNPSTKEGSPNEMIRSRSLKDAKDEIRKCIVLCAVCHRAVTAGVIEVCNLHSDPAG